MQVKSVLLPSNGNGCDIFFLPLQSQGTEEQKKKWLPLALDHRILGAYAQTELGHGRAELGHGRTGLGPW